MIGNKIIFNVKSKLTGTLDNEISRSLLLPLGEENVAFTFADSPSPPVDYGNVKRDIKFV